MRRFSETSRFDEEWYCALPLEMKAAYELLWAKADAAGVWKINHRLAEFHIGKKVDWDAMRSKCDGRIVQLDAGRYWLREFVRVNCGTLSRDCKAHIHVFKALEANGIPEESAISGYLPNSYSVATGMLQEEEEEEKEPDQETEKRGSAEGGFEEFWQAYPRRVGKGNAEKAWKRHKCDSLLPQILVAVRAAKASQDWTKERGQFIPHPATWLNRRGWEDELSSTHSRNGLNENFDYLDCSEIKPGEYGNP